MHAWKTRLFPDTHVRSIHLEGEPCHGVMVEVEEAAASGHVPFRHAVCKCKDCKHRENCIATVLTTILNWLSSGKQTADTIPHRKAHKLVTTIPESL